MKKKTGVRLETLEATADYVPVGVSVIQIIHTNLELRGQGTEEDPYRRIEQFWSLDGELLFEKDPYLDKRVIEQ